MTIETQTIEGLKALYEKATPGPWAVGGSNFLGTGVLAAGMDLVKDGPMLACWRGDKIDAEQANANADLVVAMHAALPALLTAASDAERQAEMIAALTGQAKNAEIEMERLRAENREMRIALEGLLGDYKGSWFATHGGETNFEKLPRVARARSALASLALPAPAQAEPVASRAEHDPLVEQAEALLDLDAKKALVPYGVCGLARTIIERFIARARGASKPPDGFPIMAGDGSVFFVEDAAPPPPAGEG